jgi:hypothetical protein
MHTSSSSSSTPGDEVWELMAQAIRLNSYSAADLFYMIADLTPANPPLAVALGRHAADILTGFDAEDDHPPAADWTEIVVEAYRRALFDPERSPRYGTGYFIGNPAAARAFVQHYIAQHTLGGTDGAYVEGDARAQPAAPGTALHSS